MLRQPVIMARWLGWSGLLVALVGCSSSGRHFSSLEETLSIQVMPNTSKLFVYQLTIPEGQRRNLVQVYRSPGEASQHRRTEPMSERSYRYLRQNTERALALTGYCRDGFMELDYRLSREDMWLRGECREGANQSDLNRFADRETLRIPADK